MCLKNTNKSALSCCNHYWVPSGKSRHIWFLVFEPVTAETPQKCNPCPEAVRHAADPCIKLRSVGKQANATGYKYPLRGEEDNLNRVYQVYIQYL